MGADYLQPRYDGYGQTPESNRNFGKDLVSGTNGTRKVLLWSQSFGACRLVVLVQFCCFSFATVDTFCWQSFAFQGSVESIKAEYGPYWGYLEDMPDGEDFLSIEFPRVTTAARKSFSELLIETDTLENGHLAL